MKHTSHGRKALCFPHATYHAALGPHWGIESGSREEAVSSQVSSN
jgi:hypothetical protein